MWSVVAFHFPWMREREPSISKYWVSRGAGASASSKEARKLAPSISCCSIPSTTSGAWTPTASRSVENRSLTCTIGSRTARRARVPAGQWMMSGVRVPPSQV